MATEFLPDEIIDRLLAVGEVDWGVSLKQGDADHVSDFADTLRLTRGYFPGMEEETSLHYVVIAGTSVVVANTGNSPNSAQHARIMTGAWNQLVELARKAREEMKAGQ